MIVSGNTADSQARADVDFLKCGVNHERQLELVYRNCAISLRTHAVAYFRPNVQRYVNTINLNEKKRYFITHCGVAKQTLWL